MYSFFVSAALVRLQTGVVKTPEKQGAVQGYAGSAASLAGIVGLIAGGVLYEQIGTATFLIAAGTFALVAVLSFRLACVHGAAGRERKEIGG